jgi:ketosteroid isomerase-like protein
MSQENVEIVRAAFEAWNSGGLDALAEFWDPDINWRAAEGAIDDAGELHGPEALRRHIQDWFDMFDDLSVVVEELVDAGDDRFVAVQRMTGRAKVSGIETEIRFSVVYTVRDGKIVQGREYMDKEQALDAVGLRE